MSRNKDLEPLSDSLQDVFARLGLPDPVLMSQLSKEWEELVGKHWKGRSKPVSIRGKTLVVEASTPSLVAFLKYGESALVESLEKRFGTGVFQGVEVVPPGRV